MCRRQMHREQHGGTAPDETVEHGSSSSYRRARRNEAIGQHHNCKIWRIQNCDITQEPMRHSAGRTSNPKTGFHRPRHCTSVARSLDHWIASLVRYRAVGGGFGARLARAWMGSVTLARYRRLREAKVNGGHNASLGTDYGLPEAEIQLTQQSGAPFLF
jgi:hypothetical protein